MHHLNFFASPERLKFTIYVACVNVIFGFVLYIDDAKLLSQSFNVAIRVP